MSDDSDSSITRYRGKVALVLSGVLVLGVAGLLAVGYKEADSTGDLSQGTVTLLSVILGGVVGALGTYLGMQAKGGSTDPTPATPDDYSPQQTPADKNDAPSPTPAPAPAPEPGVDPPPVVYGQDMHYDGPDLGLDPSDALTGVDLTVTGGDQNG